MGHWKGSTFKEHIREELHVFSQDMSIQMKQQCKFVNVTGGSYYDVTDTVLMINYNINASTT